MATKHDFHKVVIGRSEVLHIVGTDLDNVPSKVDTGAYRSAIHATDIKLDEQTGILSFHLLEGHPVCGALAQRLETTDFRKVVVENSFGHAEDRYEVKFKVKLGPKIFTTGFTLANRAKKVYPVLLGRKLLNHRFLVDASESSLNRAALKQKFGISFPADEDDGRVDLDSVTVANPHTES